MSVGRPSRRPPSLGRRLALVFLSLLISAGLCELLLRLLWTNPYRNELPDQILPLALHHRHKALPVDRSAIDASAPEVYLRTDDRAYLLPIRHFDHPDATIVFLGGSTTECAAVDEELRFPALVSTLLEEHGLHVTTLNAAKSGNATQDSLNVLLNHVVEDHPDVVVMMHAANDVGILYQAGSYRSRMGAPMTFAVPLRWALQAGSAHSWLLGALRNWTVGSLHPADFQVRAEKKSERADLPVDEFEHRLRAFVGIARAFDIVPVLMTQPLITMRTALTPDWTDPVNQERFNETIRRVAADEDVVLIDLARYVAEEVPGWNEPMNVFYDGVHVTNHGSRIYADYITRRLLETVFADGPPKRSEADPAD
jgi:GDSL-like Lipase/Acylhydrolase family